MHRVAVARLITEDDVPAVQALRAAALDELSKLRGGDRYEAADLPHPGDGERPVWVGVVEDTVVGYLTAHADKDLGRVDAIYVDPACRAVGVGEGMMSAALEWFGTHGCTGVDAIALPGARATKNFFEESGFTARLLVMHRPL